MTTCFQTVNGALAEFQAAGRPDLVLRSHRRSQPSPGGPPGRPGRGGDQARQSTLVNVLVRQPGLSPTGPDLATRTYIVISHGERPGGRWRRVDGAVTLREIEVNDIGEWASTDGNPGNIRLEEGWR